MSFQAIAVLISQIVYNSLKIEPLTIRKQVLCTAEEITDSFSGLLLN